MIALLLGTALAQPADATPTWVAWCDGRRATLVARVDASGPLPATGLPVGAIERLARDVAGARFHRADRPEAVTWLRPFTAPVDNETGGTPWTAGTTALGDPDHRKVVLGACGAPGLLVSAPVQAAAEGRHQLAVEVDGAWIGADVHRGEGGTTVHLTVVQDRPRDVSVELSFFGC